MVNMVYTIDGENKRNLGIGRDDNSNCHRDQILVPNDPVYDRQEVGEAEKESY